MVAQAMFLTVHIHGVAAFGVEPIFERAHEVKLHDVGQRHMEGTEERIRKSPRR
jgi:hypothetical protein